MPRPLPSPAAPETLAGLYGRPGFMLRRAHQIATAVFAEATAELGVTTTQFGILVVLHERPGIDQSTAARLLGLDRSTTGMVVAALVAAGLVTRAVAAADKRRRRLELTEAGVAMLGRLAEPAALAVERLLAPLEDAEQAALLGLLGKLTGAFEGAARLPRLEARAAGCAAGQGGGASRQRP